MQSTNQSRGIILMEYGRNIQKIVDYLLQIEDREKRTQLAYTLIELMKQINPNINEALDNTQRIWDHLYIMSNFQLDIDSEYPMPEKSILDKKPMKVDYNTHKLQFKHYGRNVELLIQKTIEATNPEEKDAAIIYLGKLMKRFYAAWNKENIEDEMIVGHLELMSKGKLMIDVERVKKEGLFDSAIREKDLNRANPSQYSHHQNHADRTDRNYKKNNKKSQYRKRGQ